jgi:hypothetical protein
VKPVSRGIDRVAVTFDEPNLVANAGLVLIATVAKRLGLERLCDTTIELSGRVGGFRPGRKILTLVHAMVAGASHIDHADMLRAGASAEVLEHRGDGTVDARDLLALVDQWNANGHCLTLPPWRTVDFWVTGLLSAWLC